MMNTVNIGVGYAAAVAERLTGREDRLFHDKLARVRRFEAEHVHHRVYPDPGQILAALVYLEGRCAEAIKKGDAGLLLVPLAALMGVTPDELAARLKLPKEPT